MSTPILYSFRRCPYAIRARMAIAVSQMPVKLREVDLQNKPAELLNCSPKATVPVLQFNGGEILDESLDIMYWALQQHDPQNWLTEPATAGQQLIRENDHQFKTLLDHYKYADRFPAYPVEHHRKLALEFPDKLNRLLGESRFLVSNQVSLVDIAVFPFIRQFSLVDKDWFYAMPWKKLQYWLDYLLAHQLFITAMKKYKPWKAADQAIIFP